MVDEKIVIGADTNYPLDGILTIPDATNKFLRIIAKKQIAKLSLKFSNIYNLTDEESKSTVVWESILWRITLRKWGNIRRLSISKN